MAVVSHFSQAVACSWYLSCCSMVALAWASVCLLAGVFLVTSMTW